MIETCNKTTVFSLFAILLYLSKILTPYFGISRVHGTGVALATWWRLMGCSSVYALCLDCMMTIKSSLGFHEDLKLKKASSSFPEVEWGKISHSYKFMSSLHLITLKETFPEWRFFTEDYKRWCSLFYYQPEYEEQTNKLQPAWTTPFNIAWNLGLTSPPVIRCIYNYPKILLQM